MPALALGEAGGSTRHRSGIRLALRLDMARTGIVSLSLLVACHGSPGSDGGVDVDVDGGFGSDPADAGLGGGPANNPDDYAAATVTFRSTDYDSAGDDPPFELLDVADLVHEPTGGIDDRGAWRLIPAPNAQQEGLAGWKWWPEAETGIDVDSCHVLVVSYLLQVSPAFVADVTQNRFPDANYGINKVIDVQMWSDDGGSADFETRQIVQMVALREGDDQGQSAPGLFLAHVNGGAGGRYVFDGDNTPLDLADHAGEWIWIAHVFDARPELGNERRTTTYYKLRGDNGVTRSLVRSAAVDYVGAGTYTYSERGWTTPGLYNSALWGYWGDIVLPADAERYISIDRLRTGNGWVDPPF